MDREHTYSHDTLPPGAPLESDEIVVAALASSPPTQPTPPPRPAKRKLLLPIGLFVATCLSTFLAGGLLRPYSLASFLVAGLTYSGAVMTILLLMLKLLI